MNSSNIEMTVSPLSETQTTSLRQAKGKSYSDLEVIVSNVTLPSRPPGGDGGGRRELGTPEKEVIPFESTDSKMLVTDPWPQYTTGAQNTAPTPSPEPTYTNSAWRPPPEYPLHRINTDVESLKGGATIVVSVPPARQGRLESLRDRLERASRRQKLIMFIGAGILLLFIILAIVLGAVLSAKSRSSSENATSSIIPSMLSAGDFDRGTNIAATNWTDASGEHRAVLYQDGTSSLQMAVYSSREGAWTTSNITESLLARDPSMGSDIKKGTPLAIAAASPGDPDITQINVYYLSNTNQIVEVFLQDSLAMGGWRFGDLVKENRKAGEKSALAVAWQLCPACSNSIILVYQDSQSTVQLLNFTKTWAPPKLLVPIANDGTGLSVMPFVDFKGNSETGTQPNAWRVYLTVSNAPVEFIMGPETGFRWEQGNFGNPLGPSFEITDSPTVGGFSYGPTGWFNNFVTYLSSNGTLQSHAWDGRNWWEQAPSLASGTSEQTDKKFNRLAVTQSLRMFITVDGGIDEYEGSAGAIFAWKYVGSVGKNADKS